ncbi:MraY family glycosyltransferase [Flavobacterium degerlachei]|jgi:UDP-N-acetylmuramyl pentapeptide phosphotransferase/UDP-N-acetylglucosamine-1-phosphate transferase|uniref:UDP-N-acetylmuramyl pentapeptide phosphotransferase/UDP-N-acetylglucosamine-1-phosphate transferase n=1 Tax=Flavobacterium degerlachei TaxID=229203 RepID=A0A1H2VTF1_9FLAO|nr:UDP-GlcNAc--UDP-phosphate GlcNAc-1-phosphate transferase [Flavobacterium degerlachei]SDW71234.1 UDP-N-acetylmuramyl pentapeptide phosphotransferase/UDP-N-acetylglucosamine-1-phosphate transferase [Flavobacterium degerlachei]
MIYIALLVLLLGIELIYFKIADRYNIIDKPNSRSSHTSLTLRGGGIIFPIAVSIGYFFGYVSLEIALAVLLVAAVSFVDDIKPLPQLPRVTSHIIAVGLVFYDLELFSESLWLLPIVFVLLIGWVNAFNFMDGINGITVLYALTAIVSFSFMSINEPSLPILITMGLSCLVFGLFNVRKKAKTFAGDVGSISMAVFLGYFMIKTILETGQLGYILFFSVYGIDAIITIIVRIKNKENIFQPHRSHLYQYMANEMGYSHVLVSFIYAGIQLLINGLVIYMEIKGNLSYFFMIETLLVLTLIYIWIRRLVFRKIIQHSS